MGEADMKNKRKMIMAAAIIALCLTAGTSAAAREESSMAIYPRVETEYVQQQKTVYIVRTGTFAVYQNAVNFSEELNNAGFYAEIELLSDNRYHVNSGTYEQYSDAEAKKTLLENAGYESWIEEVTKEVPVPVSGTEYLVQVGAFKNKTNADLYTQELMNAGFGSYSVQEEDGLYHVYCGAYEEKKDAEYVKGLLNSLGYEAYVRENKFEIDILQTYFVVQAGAFSSNENAQNYAAQLNRAGFNAYSTLAQNGYYTVFCGTFKEKANADNLKQRLIQAGYEAIVIEYQM